MKKNFVHSLCALVITLLSSSVSFADSNHLDQYGLLRDASGKFVIGYHSKLKNLCPAGTHFASARELAQMLSNNGAKGILEVSTAITLGAHPSDTNSGNFDDAFYKKTNYIEIYGKNDNTGKEDHFYFNFRGLNQFPDDFYARAIMTSTTSVSPALYYVMGVQGLFNYVLGDDPSPITQGPNWGYGIMCSK